MAVVTLMDGTTVAVAETLPQIRARIDAALKSRGTTIELAPIEEPSRIYVVSPDAICHTRADAA